MPTDAPAHATAPPDPPALLDLPAPAKINLFLHVTGRRADGYHLLETVFQYVDLCDRIDLRLLVDGAIRRRDAWSGAVAEDDDLTIRAARALQRATGCRLGVEIGLRKVIPMGAGLGGGSSDAATVLLGLNRLWNLNLSTEALIAIGVRLGADVPVFLFGRNAYATGIGDALQALDLPPRWYVLVMPATAVATASVFAAPELTRSTEPIKILGFSGRHGQGLLAGRNDLETVVMVREPAVRRVRDRLAAVAGTVAGAVANTVTAASAPSAGNRVAAQVRMTGSGACVFAMLGSAEEAHRVAGAFRAAENGGSDEGGPHESRAHESGSGSIDPAVFDQAVNRAVPAERSASSAVYVVAALPEHPLGSRQVG